MRLKTKTQPNQVRTLADTIKRMQSGNMFGVQQVPCEYDGEGDEVPHIELDPSDPLTSKQDAVESMRRIHQGVSDLLKKSEINKKAAELAAKNKAPETPSTPEK